MGHVTLPDLRGFSCPKASLHSDFLFGFLLFHMGSTHIQLDLTLTYSVLKAGFIMREAWQGVGKEGSASLGPAVPEIVTLRPGYPGSLD